MAFIRTIPDDEAGGPTKELSDADRKANGYVSNYVRLFGPRPEVYAAWRQLVSSIRKRSRCPPIK